MSHFLPDCRGGVLLATWGGGGGGRGGAGRAGAFCMHAYIHAYIQIRTYIYTCRMTANYREALIITSIIYSIARSSFFCIMPEIMIIIKYFRITWLMQELNAQNHMGPNYQISSENKLEN